MDDTTRAELKAIREMYGGTRPRWFGDRHTFVQVATDVDRLLAIIEEQERAYQQLVETLSTRAEREIEMLVEVRRNAFDAAIAPIPTSWLDSLLTGPDAVLNSKGGTWGCPEIEAVLRGVKQRLEALRDAESKGK